MALLLSPVCAETLKFQNPLLNPWKRSSLCVLPRANSALNLMGHGVQRKGCGRMRAATDDSPSSKYVADDYYEVLGLVMLCF